MFTRAELRERIAAAHDKLDAAETARDEKKIVLYGQLIHDYFEELRSLPPDAAAPVKTEEATIQLHTIDARPPKTEQQLVVPPSKSTPAPPTEPLPVHPTSTSVLNPPSVDGAGNAGNKTVGQWQTVSSREKNDRRDKTRKRPRSPSTSPYRRKLDSLRKEPLAENRADGRTLRSADLPPLDVHALREEQQRRDRARGLVDQGTALAKPNARNGDAPWKEVVDPRDVDATHRDRRSAKRKPQDEKIQAEIKRLEAKLPDLIKWEWCKQYQRYCSWHTHQPCKTDRNRALRISWERRRLELGARAVIDPILDRIEDDLVALSGRNVFNWSPTTREYSSRGMHDLSDSMRNTLERVSMCRQVYEELKAVNKFTIGGIEGRLMPVRVADLKVVWSSKDRRYRCERKSDGKSLSRDDLAKNVAMQVHCMSTLRCILEELDEW